MTQLIIDPMAWNIVLDDLCVHQSDLQAQNIIVIQSTQVKCQLFKDIKIN